MIVGLGGGGLGITRPQTPALQDLLIELPIEGAAHRGSNAMESMIHNVIRSVYPLIPVHVVPIAGIYSSVASQPLVQFPQTIIYQADTPDVVNDAILKLVWGIIFLPERMTEGGPGFDLAYEARTREVPIIFIWPDGKVTLEANQL